MNESKSCRIFAGFFVSALLAVGPILFSGCTPVPVGEGRIVFNTACRLTIYDGKVKSDLGKRRLLTDALDRIEDLDRQLDVVNATSELRKRIGSGTGGAILLSEVQASIFDRSMKAAGQFNGAFDPTLQPLVSLWGIGMGGDKQPSPLEISKALESVGYEKLKWKSRSLSSETGKQSFVEITDYPAGFGLDFGACAKGYAAGEVVRLFEESAVTSAVINIGGNVSVIGEHPEGRPWRIGIQDPYGMRGEFLFLLELESLSASTSGIYERFFYQDGKRYHHLLDRESGYPADHGLAAVTVVAEDPFLTDICSTAFFVMGGAAGEQAVLETDGVEALFIYEEGTVSITQDLYDRVNFTEESTEINFRLINPDQ